MDTASWCFASDRHFLIIMTSRTFLVVDATGFAVLAIAMVVAGVLFERLLRSLWAGTRRESAE
jgi:hypothetical protein